jgi:hypothetical protein
MIYLKKYKIFDRFFDIGDITDYTKYILDESYISFDNKSSGKVRIKTPNNEKNWYLIKESKEIDWDNWDEEEKSGDGRIYVLKNGIQPYVGRIIDNKKYQLLSGVRTDIYELNKFINLTKDDIKDLNDNNKTLMIRDSTWTYNSTFYKLYQLESKYPNNEILIAGRDVDMEDILNNPIDYISEKKRIDWEEYWDEEEESIEFKISDKCKEFNNFDFFIYWLKGKLIGKRIDVFDERNNSVYNDILVKDVVKASDCINQQNVDLIDIITISNKYEFGNKAHLYTTDFIKVL